MFTRRSILILYEIVLLLFFTEILFSTNKWTCSKHITYLKEHFKMSQCVSLSTCRAEVSLKTVNHGLWKLQMYWRVQSRAGFVVRKSLWHFQTKVIFFYYSYSFKFLFANTNHVRSSPFLLFFFSKLWIWVPLFQ